jgi:hypothetical protein
MLIKNFHSIWINIKIDSHKHFRLFLPISIYTFQELLDCVMDLLSLANLFVPREHKAYKHQAISLYTINELVLLLTNLLASITDYGPYDLVNVSCENVNVSIKIR